MMKHFSIFMIMAGVGVFFSGCVNVDYMGQKFDPLPHNARVEYFSKRAEIPAGKYRIIGRGEIKTTRRIDRYDVRDILEDEARKYGADAVAVVSMEQKNVGVYPTENGFTTATSTANASSNINPDASAREIDTFGKETKLRGSIHYRKELHVRILFLKEREALEQQLARRGGRMDELVKQPDPATPNKLIEK